MSDPVLFLALPARPVATAPGTTIVVPAPTRHPYKARRRPGSLLNLNFNQLWADALNDRAEVPSLRYFAMCHDDIEPVPGWADLLVEDLERLPADVVSSVIPLKDDRGLTSTGVWQRETGGVRRLTMTEVMSLPETFGLVHLIGAGLAEAGDVLAINTGLWVCRLDAGWAERFPGFRNGCDAVVRDDTGRYHGVCLSEDWTFALWCAQVGLAVYATRRASAAHVAADRSYPNDRAWGTWVTDRGDQEEPQS
jgi:hypothetical protein